MRISDWSSDVCSSDLIELRCDLRDIAVTVIVGSIDSQQPHTLFIGRFERITVNNSRIINENGSRLALPPLQLIEQTSERENRQDWQRDLLVFRPFLEPVNQQRDFSCRMRSEESRVGKEFVSTGRSRW